MQVHLFHTDQAEEIARYLSNIPVRFTLLISVAQGEVTERWRLFFMQRLPRLGACVVKQAMNRGRDTLPWVVTFRSEIVAHDLLLHIHTKKSDYSEALGSWRAFLLHHTMGSAGVVSDVLNIFETTPKAGLVYPPYFGALKGQPSWGGNKATVNRLLATMSLGSAPEKCPDFPAGSFFWCRTLALAPLLKAGITEEEFDEEHGQIDGTLAHAIERVVALVCERSGYTNLCAGVDLASDSAVAVNASLSGAGAVEIEPARGGRPVVVSAFYLPQFHPFAINDDHWGVGFTEWSNVARGRPRFYGHLQPKLPGDTGFYDLRLRETHEKQIELARRYGVSNFCMYYYRFGGTRAMAEPVAVFRSIKQNDVTYCYCWANESWTRAWDGATSEVILHQAYDQATLDGLIDDLAEAIKGPSYQFIDGRPVFMIYQLATVPDPASWVGEIRMRIKELTGHDLIVGSVYSELFIDTHLKCVDFVVQFPPHRIPRVKPRELISSTEVSPFEPDRGDFFESYSSVMNASLSHEALLPRMLMGVCPDWDNTSRRQKKAHVLVGSTPYEFRKWVAAAKRSTCERYERGDIPVPMMFVNAWNEWAEGAMLEPGAHHGHAYLEALKAGLGGDHE